jgi:hypothetical protein
MSATDRVPAADRTRHVGYAYPWDVIGDPGFVDRVRALGISRVGLAAAYHTTRAATPFHPQSRLVSARTAALYRPVRPEAWAGRRLVPAAAEWVRGDDPFGDAAAVLVDAGIEVAAWVVLTHSTRLGETHPDLAVVNCFGEPYPFALCPQSAEVREYAATLTAEALREVPCSAVVLEACGQLGIQHGGHHDKTDGAYDEQTQRLLSICCCAACREAWAGKGLEPTDVVASLRAAVEQATTPSAAMLDAVLRVRQVGTDALRRSAIRAARDAAPGFLEIVLHGHPDPWGTGALPGLTPAAVGDVDVVVAPCWATGERSVETARELAAALDGRAVPGAYVTVLPPTAPADFAPHLAALEEAGIRQFHLYHLGLAGPERHHLLAEATPAASDIRS